MWFWISIVLAAMLLVESVILLVSIVMCRRAVSAATVVINAVGQFQEQQNKSFDERIARLRERMEKHAHT